MKKVNTLLLLIMHHPVLNYVGFQVYIHVFLNLKLTAVIGDVQAPATLYITRQPLILIEEETLSVMPKYILQVHKIMLTKSNHFWNI
jgi:hypothetical protein